MNRNTVCPIRGRALITGGTSGIGLAFAQALARRGLDLVLVARNEDALHDTAHQLQACGIKCEVLSADLSTPEGVESVLERLADASNPVNVFINNAGQGLYHELSTLDDAPLIAGIELMATVPVRLGGAAAYHFAERCQEAQGEHNALIINTASVSSLVPMGLYSGIKALVRTWSLSLAIELQNSPVHVVTFMPGWVRTQFHARAGVQRSNLPSWIWLNAEEIVEECLRDAERGKLVSTPSRRFRCISWLARCAPQSLVYAMSAKINKGRRRG